MAVIEMSKERLAGPTRWWVYAVSFALIGIGNTIVQAALPALMSNVVAADQLTSRISLGQFVKAICAALAPVFVYLTATALGNRKLLFPLYGLLTVVCGIWLQITPITDERCGAQGTAHPTVTTFESCFSMLRNPSVAAMTVGMCMGLAIDREPSKANEITALMVMAIIGGAVVTPVPGFAQSSFGASGVLAGLIACLTYLLALGLFASRRRGK